MGLESDKCRLKDEADTDTLEQENHHNGTNGRASVEYAGKANTDRPEKETCPDHFSISFSTRDVLSRKNRCNHLCAGDR